MSLELLSFLQGCKVNVNTIDDILALTKLDLSDNDLTSIPPEIGSLTNLTHLGLFDNDLTSLPPEIGNLTNLTYLSFSWNRLISIPPEIGNLTNLIYLILSDNDLTSIPPEIGNLTKLKTLNLYGNKLTSLPFEIDRLPKELFGFRFLHLYNSSATRNKCRRTISALRIQRIWFKYWWVPNEEGVARKALHDWREISFLM